MRLAGAIAAAIAAVAAMLVIISRVSLRSAGITALRARRLRRGRRRGAAMQRTSARSRRDQPAPESHDPPPLTG
jgi:hypothetical protein